MTGADPEELQEEINTQDPTSWSDVIRLWGMKLAYCPSDTRKLRFFMEELIALDDLFTLSYYTAPEPATILRDPDESGWICGSHIVVLHRDRILDPSRGDSMDAREHRCNNRYTKRIFRVVPKNYFRGL
jgi:hypothetical protein